MANKHDWQRISDSEPPQGSTSLTRIDDVGGGIRNETPLRRQGRLWFNDSMYVYYTPTHYAADTVIPDPRKARP